MSSLTKKLVYRRHRIAYRLFVATAHDPPTHLRKAKRVRGVLENLAWFLMGPPVNLDYDLLVQKGKVGDMAQAKERMLRSIAPS